MALDLDLANLCLKVCCTRSLTLDGEEGSGALCNSDVGDEALLEI